MSNEVALIEVPTKKQVMAAFTEGEKLEPYIQLVIDKVEAFVPDISTAKGRAEIASMARKVASSKVALDDAGKNLVADLKKKPNIVDAERRRMREIFDRLKKEVRQPLTDFEDAENARIEAINEKLSRIRLYKDFTFEASESVQAEIDVVGADLVGFDEMQEQAEAAQELALLKLREIKRELEAKEQAEAETEKQRLAELEKARIEREAQIAKEAEERAKQEAAEQALKVKQEAEAKALKIKQEAEAKANAEREAAEKRELELKLEAETAEKKRLEAEREAAQAEERAKQAKQKAIDDLAAKEADEQAEAEKREANKKHKASIHNAIKDALVNGGLSEKHAKLVIIMIAKQEVPNVTINY